MKIVNMILMAIILVLLVSVVCVWFIPSKQDFTPSNISWNGINDLCADTGAGAVQMDGSYDIAPETAAIIEIPYRPYSETELENIRQFVIKGGTLVLSDDYGYGNSVLEYLGLEARFSGHTVLDPLFCDGSQELPAVSDFDMDIHESGIRSVILNHATSIENIDTENILVWSTPASFLDVNNNGAEEDNEAQGPFAIAGRFSMGLGIIVVLSDPSIMINSMYGLADNSAFMKYLVNISGNDRDVFVDDSKLAQANLDTAKAVVAGVRREASPLIVLAVIALFMLFVSKYIIVPGVKNV